MKNDNHYKNSTPILPLPGNRSELEKYIESLICILDALDPDPDLEDSGDGEPEVGNSDRELDISEVGAV